MGIGWASGGPLGGATSWPGAPAAAPVAPAATPAGMAAPVEAVVASAAPTAPVVVTTAGPPSFRRSESGYWAALTLLMLKSDTRTGGIAARVK